MTLNRDIPIRRNPRVVSRSLGTETGSVLLHLDTSLYFGTNRIGAIVWELLEDDITVEHLLMKLRDRIDSTPTTLEEDTAEFLNELHSRDMIHIAAAEEYPAQP